MIPHIKEKIIDAISDLESFVEEHSTNEQLLDSERLTLALETIQMGKTFLEEIETLEEGQEQGEQQQVQNEGDQQNEEDEGDMPMSD